MHPLVREDDVSFVLSTVASRSAAAENAAREKEDEERALDGGGRIVAWKVSNVKVDPCSCRP